MNDVNTTTGLSRLDQLAAQARAYTRMASESLFLLGETLAEARSLVPGDRWVEWVEVNTGMTTRRAEELIQCWTQLGGRPEYADFSKSKILAFLTAPEEARQRVLEREDVQEMSTRELKAALAEEKARLRAEAMEEARQTAFDELAEQIAEAERRARDAEIRADALEDQAGQIPEDAARELEEARESVDRYGRMVSEAKRAQAEAERQVKSLERDLADAEDTIAGQQEALNRAQSDLLAMQSERARGEAARDSPADLTADALAAAVREFCGLCARAPYMAAAFAGMTTQERGRYAELVSTVEGWCEGVRRALASVAVEGGVIVA